MRESMENTYRSEELTLEELEAQHIASCCPTARRCRPYKSAHSLWPSRARLPLARSTTSTSTTHLWNSLMDWRAGAYH